MRVPVRSRDRAEFLLGVDRRRQPFERAAVLDQLQPVAQIAPIHGVLRSGFSRSAVAGITVRIGVPGLGGLLIHGFSPSANCGGIWRPFACRGQEVVA
jgi:hypothetical protein